MDAAMNVLKLTSSLQGSAGQSSRLAAAFVERLSARSPGVRVVERDLAQRPVPHLTAERFAAFATGREERTLAQQAIVAESDALIAELAAADTIVIGLPLYNFGVPSTLKAYFDHVARAGVTFRYTANGPEGLLRGKRAIVVAARGGRHAGTPQDTQTGYIRDFLRFLGIADVAFVYAEGLALGDAPRESALADASRRLVELAAPEALAA
jgi:FMN-dependent NADH-azoreductase